MNREFSYFYRGRARRLLVPITVSHGSISQQVQALWDTGATQTCIASNVASSLGIKPFAKRKTITPVSGMGYLPLYRIDVTLPNSITIPRLEALGANIGVQGLGILIGMDIITLGNFSILVKEDHTQLAFSFEG